MAGDDANSLERRRRHCKYCHKFYQKHEHLIRHERTHTGDKPFSCNICKRPFARLDTLGRHKKTHNRPSAQDLDDLPESIDFQHSLEHQPISPSDARWDWHQQSQDIPPVDHPAEVAPIPNSLPYPNFDSTNMFPFNETEDLFQYLCPTPGMVWSLPLTPGRPSSNIYHQESNNFGHTPSATPGGTDETSPPALLQLDALIRDSATYRREIRQKGITCSFFDVCLSLYFSRFNSTFPIIHEPTWTLNTTIPFLSLNMVAIGSLFLGTEDAAEKGELLWDLTYEAASSRWNYVYEQGMSKQKSNTQIITCSVLGQLYAMMSKSSRLRHMAQTAHGWAFAWARKLGMFEIPDWTTGDRPDMAMSAEEKYDMWKAWANVESCRRTTLGLFMIDAQLARYNGGLPVGKHVLNPLSCATPDSIFNAATADDWVLEMNRNWKRPPSFRELYLSIFDVESAREMPLKSPFSVAVLLEGIQAVISERSAASGNAVGIPSDHNITQALLNLWTSCLETPNSDVDMLELRLQKSVTGVQNKTSSVQGKRHLARQKIPQIGHKASVDDGHCSTQLPFKISLDAYIWVEHMQQVRLRQSLQRLRSTAHFVMPDKPKFGFQVR